MKILAIGIFKLSGGCEYIMSDSSSQAVSAVEQLEPLADRIKKHPAVQNGQLYKIPEPAFFHYTKIDNGRIYLFSSEEDASKEDIIMHFSDMVELIATDQYELISQKIFDEHYMTPRAEKAERLHEEVKNIILLELEEEMKQEKEKLDSLLFTTKKLESELPKTKFKIPKKESFSQKVRRFCCFFPCCTRDDINRNDYELLVYSDKKSRFQIN